MQSFIVRPYYGHDCCSENGFNNGYYLDEMVIAAENEEQAQEIACKKLISSGDWNTTFSTDSPFSDTILMYWEYDHTNIDGNSLTAEEYIALDEENRGNYRYQYVDFSDCRKENQND